MKYYDINNDYYNILPWIDIHMGDIHGHKHCLNESTYKELSLLIDPNFLDQGLKAKQLRNIHLKGFEDNTMIMEIDSSLGNGKYRNLFRMPQMEEMVQDLDLKPMEAAKLLVWAGDIQLHCSCPSFLYHGYQYMLTVLNSSIIPEERPPKKTNPHHNGAVCKHLNRTLKAFPFHISDIAKEIKRIRG
jgi:hypothetical protein